MKPPLSCALEDHCKHQLLWGCFVTFRQLLREAQRDHGSLNLQSTASYYAVMNDLIVQRLSRVPEHRFLYPLSLGDLGVAWDNTHPAEKTLFPLEPEPIVSLSPHDVPLMAQLPGPHLLFQVVSISGWRRTNSFRFRVLKALLDLLLQPKPPSLVGSASAPAASAPRISSHSRSRASTTDSESSTTAPMPRSSSSVDGPSSPSPCSLEAASGTDPDPSPENRSLDAWLDHFGFDCQSIRSQLKSRCSTDFHLCSQGGLSAEGLSCLAKSEEVAVYRLVDSIFAMPPTPQSLPLANKIFQLLPGVWIDFTCQRQSPDEANMTRNISHIVSNDKCCFLSSNPHRYNYLFVRNPSSPKAMSRVLFSSALYIYKALIAGGSVMVTSGTDNIGLATIATLCMSMFYLPFLGSWKILQRRLPSPIATQMSRLLASPGQNNLRAAMSKLEMKLVRTPLLIPEFPASSLQ